MTEMTEREALEVLEKTIGCETLPYDKCLTRNCLACDYGVTSDELAEAIKVAAGILRRREEVAKVTEEGFEVVENVRVSPELAYLLRPYQGCPRGAMGLPGHVRETPAGAISLLGESEKYALEGPDETFVCVPKPWFDLCRKSLLKLTGKEPQTEGEAGI